MKGENVIRKVQVPNFFGSPGSDFGIRKQIATRKAKRFAQSIPIHICALTQLHIYVTVLYTVHNYTYIILHIIYLKNKNVLHLLEIQYVH